MINTPNSSEHVETPRKQIVCALIVQDGKLLMVHNIKHGLRIEPPGGKVDPEKDQSIEEAVIRENREELSIKIEIIEKLCIKVIATPEGPFDNHLFLARIVSGTPTIPPEEAHKLGGFGWYSFDEIRHMKEVVPEVPQILEMLEERTR